MTHGWVIPWVDEELSPLYEGAAAMCSRCRNKRREAQLWAEATARQAEETAKGLLGCPMCDAGMTKELVRLGDVIIIVDVCPNGHGEFYSVSERNVLIEHHHGLGYNQGYRRAEQAADSVQALQMATMAATISAITTAGITSH
jgi:Zn-finger nucleic acid-binding protein